MMSKYRTAGIYLRQSQEHDTSISMTLQEATVRAMAEREGLEVVGVWRDDDTSGRATRNRPGLRDLRAAYDRGEFDVALAHSVSRFSRTMRDGAEIVAQMPVGSVLEGMTDPDDDFPVLLHLLLAHKQSREIGKRWGEVKSYRASQLKLPPSGGKRFGYVYTPASTTAPDGSRVRTAPEDTYKIDEELAPVIRDLYARYLQGQGFSTLTEVLNSAGIPSQRGGTWNVSKVHTYMDSGFAAGYFKMGEDLERGAWERIISEDVWRAYLRERKLRKRKTPRERGSTWELQGVAKCAKCGGPLSISTSNGVAYARCSRYKNAGPSVCTGVMYRASGLAEQAWGMLAPRLEDLNSLVPDRSEERTKLEGEISKIDEDLEDVSETQGNLATGWASGMLDHDGYLNARKTQDDRKRELEARREQLDLELAQIAPVPVLEPLRDAPGRRDWQLETDRAVQEVRHELAFWEYISTRMEEMTPQELSKLYGSIWKGIYISDESVRFVWADGSEEELSKLSARHKGARMRNKTASGVHREIRQWCAEQGIMVGGGGALSLDLIERWEAATGRDRSVSPLTQATVSQWASSEEGQVALREAGLSYSGKGRPSEDVRELFRKLNGEGSQPKQDAPAQESDTDS